MSLHVLTWASIELRSVHITTNDGIANNSIRYIFQDSKGFIWFGTLNGLSRYDGNSFVNFRPDSSDSISLADHRIRQIDEDNNGFLWINTFPDLFSCYDLKKDCFVDFTGCGEYNQHYSNKLKASNNDIWLYQRGNGCRKITYKDGKFSSVVYKEETGNLPTNHIKYIYEDFCKRIWIGTDKGVYLVRGKKTQQIVKDNHAFAALSYNQKVFFISQQGSISVLEKGKSCKDIAAFPKGIKISDAVRVKDNWLIATSKGVYLFNLNTYQISYDTQLNISSDGRITQDNRHNYWIYNHTGKVWYVNATTGAIKNFQLMPNNKVGYIDRERYTIIHDSRDIIWISTYGNGLFAYNVKTDELQHFTANINGFSHIDSDFLQHIMMDRSKGLWVSSEYAGVSRLTMLNEDVRRVYPEDKSLSDRSNTIRMITYLKNNDEIWVSTRNGGLYTYNSNLSNKEKEHFYKSNIYAIAEDSEGKLWLGTRGDGLCIDGKWYKRNSTSSSVSYNHIFCIHQDRKKRMWVGTFGGGLDLVTKENGKYKFTNFLNDPYTQKQIRVIAEDKNGYIWAGTSDGVYVFQPDSIIANPDNYIEYNKQNGKLRNNEIKCFCYDKEGRMWIGTSGGGFSVCKPEGDYSNLKFKHYDSRNGLVNSMVQSIIEDRNGNLWIATEYGISCFHPDSQTFQNFFFSAYELGNVYCENSGLLCKDGKILFGSNYGMVVLNPESIISPKNHSTSTPPQTVLTNLRINGAEVRPGTHDSPLTRSIAYTDNIELKHYQNSFIINFSIFDYSKESREKYTYKLEPYDADWSIPSPLNFASYKNLLPGTYTLRIRACNNNGVWSDKETTLKITINPPYWETTWAYIIYTLVIATIVYFLFRLIHKLNNYRNRIEIEKQLTEYKLVFFTNISHEFRTPLTLIQGALEKIESSKKLPKEITYSLKIMDKSTQRMLRLINQLLEFRKMQNNKLALSLEETDVIAFLYEIFLCFKDVSESKKMNFQFHTSADSYKMFIDKGYVDKITYNLLSNAFKYTPSNGKIIFSVNVSQENNKLIISVSDTGVGIPKEKRDQLFKRFMQSNFSGSSMGVGLHLSYELVNVHKGTITYNENEGGGSVFTVTLPLDPSVYEEKDFLIPNKLLSEEQEAQHLKDVLVEDEINENIQETAHPLNEKKILIIEDDNDVREFLKEEIGQHFEVVAESDGISGLERARNYDADLIICDVLMPGMNGFEVTRKLKEDFTTSHIPIILLTALDSPDKQLEGVETGADAYITKPFSPKYLLTRIYKLIEQREKLREKFSNDPTNVKPALCTSNKDQEFAEELQTKVEAHIHNLNFTVEDLISMMNMGRTIFYRKVRGVTGYSPNKYIHIIRLKKAAELLRENKHTVSEICYMVGMNDPFYFSKCFKQQFGVAPSVYQKNTDSQDTSPAPSEEKES